VQGSGGAVPPAQKNNAGQGAPPALADAAPQKYPGAAAQGPLQPDAAAPAAPHAPAAHATGCAVPPRQKKPAGQGAPLALADPAPQKDPGAASQGPLHNGAACPGAPHLPAAHGNALAVTKAVEHHAPAAQGVQLAGGGGGPQVSAPTRAPAPSSA
jgi:hypothetical protein